MKAPKAPAPKHIVHLFSQHDTSAVKRPLTANGIAVRDAPGKGVTLIITYGGDGTFLLAEERFPGVPKLLLRKSDHCKKCHGGRIEDAISMLEKGGLRTTHHMKLEAAVIGKRKLKPLAPAVNNIIIRSAHPAQALRFTIDVDGKQLYDEVIGDGVIIATPFGASGYYQSATRQTFERGIGIGLSNPVTRQPALICAEDTTIAVRITRGEAQVCGDTGSRILNARPGDAVIVKRSAQRATIMTLPS